MSNTTSDVTMNWARWMTHTDARLTAIEEQHLAIAAKLRELADGLSYPVNSVHETRQRLRELADLIDRKTPRVGAE